VTKAKRKAYFWGWGAEWLAIAALTLKGYRLLARRFRCKSGEIDLIARKGDMICFVEVKARKRGTDALHALSRRQQQRISRAAEWYISRRFGGGSSKEGDIFYRFDLMAVEPWRWPAHVKDAWRNG